MCMQGGVHYAQDILGAYVHVSCRIGWLCVAVYGHLELCALLRTWV